MKLSSLVWTLLISLCLNLLGVSDSFGQALKSSTASFSESAPYPTFSGKDYIYYFCGIANHQDGTLKATSLGQSVTFKWEKYTQGTGAFTFYFIETGTSSTLNSLSDGCYRVSFTENGINYVLRAWIINTWMTVTSTITDSNCQSFKLLGVVNGPSYAFADLTTNQVILIDPSYKYVWQTGSTLVSNALNPTVLGPPPINTIYQLQVTDRAGCMVISPVTYQSIVPKAKFSWKTNQPAVAQYSLPEAPLPVQFINESINGDVEKFEWFLFKEKSSLSNQPKGAKIDSIMEEIYLKDPSYTYEHTGSYMVKLIAAKQSPGFTCRDTMYLKDYIVIDSSLVKVAPAFTPNGDGVNDILMIRTRSLQSLDFQIFNRWGRIVHHFRKSGYVPADTEMATWDGKINNVLASPGVYFYVADGQGRDGKRRRKKGFIELIW
jgi:gliding motility-associated-like protein